MCGNETGSPPMPLLTTGGAVNGAEGGPEDGDAPRSSAFEACLHWLCAIYVRGMATQQDLTNTSAEEILGDSKDRMGAVMDQWV